ncbi:hypothetical protein [Massilia niabensis]|uniref:Uncharacterized protein n=1 Tax=Massilia niabensis TaxID=544910 RepID=A0ABW0L527_9BURK
MNNANRRYQYHGVKKSLASPSGWSVLLEGAGAFADNVRLAVLDTKSNM